MLQSRPDLRFHFLRVTLAILCVSSTICSFAAAGTRTWDGKFDTTNIEVTVVYFIPQDRPPLPDWRERVDYFTRRLEQFHEREFQGQSTLSVKTTPEPFVSAKTTAQLRVGDGDAIFFATLREVDERLKFAQTKQEHFPILLVLSEINWRPLDDFYRLHPITDDIETRLTFEGNYSQEGHFPGAASGGARATYLSRRGVGWGLVSADGWRVPYRGSDCVVYHEGCGHTVGLPHPEPGNGSVMSLGQYQGWISESWLDKDQKARLGWEPSDVKPSPQLELFSTFRALPKTKVPRPGDEVLLKLDWPIGAKVKRLQVRTQTDLWGPWVDHSPTLEALPADAESTSSAPQLVSLGRYDRPTPISYRVDAELEDGSTAEIWGYLQVRANPRSLPQPSIPSPDLMFATAEVPPPTIVHEARPQIDLLSKIEIQSAWSNGAWTLTDGKLESPKQYGARIEIPHHPPTEYRLIAIVEPLDPPNGFLLGLPTGKSRFAALTHYQTDGKTLSALENVNGKNVGNETTNPRPIFEQGRQTQIIVTVRPTGVTMTADGEPIIHWTGTPDQLSLSDYWKTPDEKSLFIGAYDCRYKVHRLSLEPLGKPVAEK